MTSVEDGSLFQWLTLAIGIIALIISFYSIYLNRAHIHKEHFSREITFGPIEEEISTSIKMPNNMTISFQLSNETGIPLIVNEVWLRIIKFPTSVTDEQYERFRDFIVQLMDVGLSLYSEKDMKENVSDQIEVGVLKNTQMYLLSIIYMVFMKIRSGGTRNISQNEAI
jgi:hypothetical protein